MEYHIFHRLYLILKGFFKTHCGRRKFPSWTLALQYEFSQMHRQTRCRLTFICYISKKTNRYRESYFNNETIVFNIRIGENKFVRNKRTILVGKASLLGNLNLCGEHCIRSRKVPHASANIALKFFSNSIDTYKYFGYETFWDTYKILFSSFSTFRHYATFEFTLLPLHVIFCHEDWRTPPPYKSVM